MNADTGNKVEETKQKTDGGSASKTGERNNTVPNGAASGGTVDSSKDKTPENSTTGNAKAEAAKSETVQSNTEAVKQESIASYSVNDIYTKGNGRLIDFQYNNGVNDKATRAYMKLMGVTENMKELLTTTSGVSAYATGNEFNAILNTLMNGYNAFILTSIQENLQEKQSILPTIGDYFAVTFAGAQPQVIAFTGLLPFDDRGRASWFIYFMNAYNTFLRASVLARTRCVLRLSIPEYMDYNCYPMGITCGLTSDSDTLVNFSVQALVVNDFVGRAYGYPAGAVDLPGNVASAIKNSTSESSTDKASQEGKTNTPAEVGNKANAATQAKNKNIFTSASAAINKGMGAVTSGINKFAGKAVGTLKDAVTKDKSKANGKGETSKTKPDKV